MSRPRSTAAGAGVGSPGAGGDGERLDVAVGRRGGRLLVRLTGALGPADAPLLLEAVPRSRRRDVVVDLRALAFVDAAALAVLRRLDRRCRADGVRLVVVPGRVAGALLRLQALDRRDGLRRLARPSGRRRAGAFRLRGTSP
jgi:anti-anti-sigma factor